MENTNPNNNSTASRVQHVAKSSSDQLLRKFAEVGTDSNDKSSSAKDLRLAKRAKTSQEIRKESKRGNNKILGERKSLLPPQLAAPRKSTALIRKLGICRAKIRARDIKNKSIITALGKTWRRTVEGASRVLMEKHYNRHKRLIDDS
ncbi:hypothetical protein ABFS82_10G171900 [Erythranthe guttata]|uniref:Uncharacterized protein n=1 Tax=Erythranthe guttata TaxID=4155 RepID=A0A022RHU2_ERYGU|nr:PREDICTED: uncharacterized protein LOC105955233 [Erythranthe guttata]EYU39942.1 hypothetical protein MIMGU_mgv1a015779mg [Erythranthe guttata]|eukprot:XP_012834397.1 PREDICTED: uncharacterized protein LOC105955233 [Erythranthe guttata]